ncbi:ketosteroid isomerase-like protein [Candidatus Magnetomorum sp. HK-1]|nr:ketosteroid isomerase-like protein [Candidatus Magnetomorum sp. HK-1]
MDDHITSIDEIMELERETCRRFQAGDVEFAMDQFVDNVVLLNPGSEILVGKEHERAALIEASKMKDLEMSWEPTEANVSASEDLAYVYGIIKIKTPDNVEMTEKYVTIWKKIDSKWKLALQIRNSNQ